MKFFTTSKISDNIHETPEGYLVCVGVSIARTGMMDYGPGETPLDPGPNGLVKISRDAKDVFNPKTIASFQGKALTIQHPDAFVHPKNWSQLAKGILQNVRQGEGDQANDLVADILVTSHDAIDLVKNGLREVSCGYEADWEETGPGQGTQKNIIGNHLALVDEGRAGSAYAINDHKRKGSVMKLSEKIKAIFAKAQDEALNAAVAQDDLSEKDKGGAQVSGYDELCKAVKDLGGMISAMQPKKDAAPPVVPKAKDDMTPATENQPATTVAKDDDVNAGMEARMAKLEAAVQKLLAMKSGAEDDDDADSEEAEDDEMDGNADVEDDADDIDGKMVGDTASRIEILAPGMTAKGKDAKAKALRTAYATTDGKAVIDQFTAGKAPDYKNEKFVDVLFTAASEVMKSKRAKELSRTRASDWSSNLGVTEGAMTPEKINELNAKHYASRTAH